MSPATGQGHRKAAIPATMVPDMQIESPASGNEPWNDDHEARACWPTDAMLATPELAALREVIQSRETSGYSFVNVRHHHRVTATEWFNRHTALELICQHLEAIGFHHTSRELQSESGLPFMNVEQPWERSDLRLIASLAVDRDEDVWAVVPRPDEVYVDEQVDDDFLSANYREDPSTIHLVYRDPLKEVIMGEQQGFISAGSLRRLIVYHLVQNLNTEERQLFITALPALTSSFHFVEHVSALLLYLANRNRPDQSKRDTTSATQVFAFLQLWVKKGSVGVLARERLQALATKLAQECEIEEIRSRFMGGLFGRAADAAGARDEGKVKEPPNLPDLTVVFRRPVDLLAVEPEEVARQISLLAHEKFKAIRQHELWAAIRNGGPYVGTPQLVEFWDFRERVRRIAARAVLQPAAIELRGKALRRWLAICAELLKLRNFDTAAGILEFLTPAVVRLCVVAEPQAEVVDTAAKLSQRAGRTESRAVYDEERNASVSRPFVPNLAREIADAHRGQRDELEMITDLLNWRRLRSIAIVVSGINQGRVHSYASLTAVPQIQRAIGEVEVWSRQEIERRLEDCQVLVQEDAG